VFFLGDDLRSHVFWSSTLGGGPAFLCRVIYFRLELLCKAEVDQFQMSTLLFEHKVLRLDVSVDDVLPLELFDDIQTLSCKVLDQLSIQTQVVFQESVQVQAFDQLHLEDQVLGLDLLARLVQETESVDEPGKHHLACSTQHLQDVPFIQDVLNLLRLLDQLDWYDLEGTQLITLKSHSFHHSALVPIPNDLAQLEVIQPLSLWLELWLLAAVLTQLPEVTVCQALALLSS
jgi:hypothetical protein